jgi:hypothetical protein
MQIGRLAKKDLHEQDFPSRVIPSILGTTEMASSAVAEKALIKTWMHFLSSNIYSKKVSSPIDLLPSK